jgi:hypothetical protein
MCDRIKTRVGLEERQSKDFLCKMGLCLVHSIQYNEYHADPGLPWKD